MFATAPVPTVGKVRTVSWAGDSSASHQKLSAGGQKLMNAEGSKASSELYIGRWTPKILFSLHGRPYRHGELRRQLGSVSQRMLTRTLRNLESTGLIARRVTISKAIAVEYSLTKLGRTIIAPLRGMCRWARRHGRRVSAEVHLRQSETINAKNLS